MNPVGTLVAADDVDDETEPSRLVGRYRLVREIAAGGMASVHLASAESSEGFNKLVAIKLIHEHLARDASFVDMFLDEARIAARIEHANVCTVFDFGQSEGTYFIAMEYLVGETFGHVRDAVKRRGADSRWPVIAASLAMQACEGLHAAHELEGPDGVSVGLVHRDVSPHNLFVTYGGVVKVVDFGIARAEGRSHHTTPGTLKGKFAYMAPEQLTGGDDIDRRVDVWALGVTLWELLTLRPLFKKSTAAETLSRVLGDPIVPPSELMPGIPAELDAIVLKALTRSPDRRYPNARALGRDLAKFCRTHEGPLGPIELEEWLGDLFPENRRQKLSLAALAREQTQARISRSLASKSIPLDGTPSHGTQAVGTPSHGMANQADHSRFVVRSTLPLDAAPTRRGQVLRTVAKVALIVAALGLGATFAAFTRGPRSADAPANAPSRAVTSPAVADDRARVDGAQGARIVTPRTDAPTETSVTEARAREAIARRETSMVSMASMREPVAVRTPVLGVASAEPTPVAPSPAPPSAPVVVVAAAQAPPPPVAVVAPQAATSPVTATAVVPSVAPTPAPSITPTFDANVSFRSLNVRGSVPATSIRATLDRVGSQLRGCYRTSARSAGHDAAADIGVRFAIDENGSVRNVSSDDGALGRCVQGVVSRLRPRERPDIGFIQVSVVVHFTPVRAEATR